MAVKTESERERERERERESWALADAVVLYLLHAVPYNTVVVAGQYYGSQPTRAKCPYCQTDITTNIRYKVGGFAWLVCASIFCLGLTLCLCLLP